MAADGEPAPTLGPASTPTMPTPSVQPEVSAPPQTIAAATEAGIAVMPETPAVPAPPAAVPAPRSTALARPQTPALNRPKRPAVPKTASSVARGSSVKASKSAAPIYVVLGIGAAVVGGLFAAMRLFKRKRSASPAPSIASRASRSPSVRAAIRKPAIARPGGQVWFKSHPSHLLDLRQPVGARIITPQSLDS